MDSTNFTHNAPDFTLNRTGRVVAIDQGDSLRINEYGVAELSNEELHELVEFAGYAEEEVRYETTPVAQDMTFYHELELKNTVMLHRRGARGEPKHVNLRLDPGTRVIVIGKSTDPMDKTPFQCAYPGWPSFFFLGNGHTLHRLSLGETE